MEKKSLKKILITGCHGQLGIALNSFYNGNSDVQLVNTDVQELDITDLSEVLKSVEQIHPDVIINCAAYTAVDKCEEDVDRAHQLNAIGPKNLSIAANNVGATIVHISTDYVFDGNKKEPYIEEDIANPQSVYGSTKWAGEQFVKDIAKKYFIVRTAWLYGEGKNFVRTMLHLAAVKQSISVVDDQLGSPTSAAEVAKVIDILIQSNKYGVYHGTCEGICSWYEFAQQILKLGGFKTTIVPVKTKEYPTVAKRPAYSVLDNKKLREEFGYVMADWHDALIRYINENKKESNCLMSKKRVLVTGANGYIGRHVVAALLSQGHEVLAADFGFEGLDERAIRVNVPIFSKDKDIYKQLGEPDVCIHMAWRNGFVHNADSHLIDLPDHYIFIKNMVEGGLKQLAVMGTMHEVGYWEGPIDENTPTNPISLYGIAKNSLRQMVDLIVKDKPTIVQWLRAYYITGDDLKSNSIFSKIAKMENEGAKKFPFTTGKNKYDFISVDELSEQIAAASTQEDVTGIINCCTGNPLSLAEKVESYIASNGYKIQLEYGAFPDRPYDSPGVWGDATKIKKVMAELKA